MSSVQRDGGSILNMNSLRFAFRLRGRRAGCSALRCVTVTPMGEFCGADSASVQRGERLVPTLQLSLLLSAVIVVAIGSSRFRVQLRNPPGQIRVSIHAT
jgi:hypothetical protein